MLEVHATHRKSVSLLRTYLGRKTGERVLEGLVRRGDNETIDAVIWFCDLRRSTQLAESLSPEQFLATLNDFYDAVAEPVAERLRSITPAGFDTLSADGPEFTLLMARRLSSGNVVLLGELPYDRDGVERAAQGL